MKRHCLSIRPLLWSLVAMVLFLEIGVCEGGGEENLWRETDESLAAYFGNDGPGGYAIASRNGKTLYARAFGLANVELAVPVSDRTVFRIASLTKQFTAVGIMRLVEQGRLDLDEPLERLLSPCPTPWTPITIRQLLSQTSGLTGDLGPVMPYMRDDLTPTGLVELYANSPLAASPGEAFNYSNLNYWILGLVLENLSGGPYQDFIRAEVLAPAEIQDTRYGSFAQIIPNRAAGYTVGAGGSVSNAPYFSSTLGYSAGGFVSKPDDLARWYHALASGQILKLPTLEQMLTEVSVAEGVSGGYGLGWYLSEIDGIQVAHHGGDSLGFRAYVYWLAKADIFVGVFANSYAAQAELEPQARQILETVWRGKPGRVPQVAHLAAPQGRLADINDPIHRSRK